MDTNKISHRYRVHTNTIHSLRADVFGDDGKVIYRCSCWAGITDDSTPGKVTDNALLWASDSHDTHAARALEPTTKAARAAGRPWFSTACQF